jgi:hypothetical protein
MAKQTGDIKIEGTIDEICFYQMLGNIVAEGKAPSPKSGSGMIKPSKAREGAVGCWEGFFPCLQTIQNPSERTKKQGPVPDPYWPSETATSGWMGESEDQGLVQGGVFPGGKKASCQNEHRPNAQTSQDISLRNTLV